MHPARSLSFFLGMLVPISAALPVETDSQVRSSYPWRWKIATFSLVLVLGNRFANLPVRILTNDKTLASPFQNWEKELVARELWSLHEAFC